MSDPFLTDDESAILRAFQHTMDEHEWGYVRASFALDGPVPRHSRKAIRNLVRNGMMALVRGGQDEEGQVIGGTFYSITPAGRAALSPTPEG